MSLFYFIRHGETEWNAAGRLCGRTDVPLSDVGRRQAQLVADRLKPMQVEALYCSALQRARESAQIIGATLDLDPHPDSRLVEISYGTWEGKTHAAARSLTPDIHREWELDPARVAPPAGESGEQLVERVKPFLAELAVKHPTGNVAVVCHRTLCRLVVCHFNGVPLAEYRTRIPMDNAALNIFEWKEGKWRVLTVNDTAHLSVPLPETATTL